MSAAGAGDERRNSCFAAPTEDALIIANGGRVRRYQIGGLNVLTRLAHQPLPLRSLAFSATGEWLVCTAAFKQLRRSLTVWHTATGQLLGKTEADGGSPGYASLHPGLPVVAHVTSGTEIEFWDYEKKQPARESHRLADVNNVAFDRTGRRFLAISDEQSFVRSWDWPNLDNPTAWTDPTSVLTGTGQLYCLDAGSCYVVAGSRDGGTHLLSNDLTYQATFIGLSNPVRTTALSPDERLAASGFQDGHVWLYRVPDGAVACKLHDHQGSVNSIHFSPDGKLLATAGRDGKIHLYRLGTTPEKLLTFRPAGAVEQVRFHPDGGKLAFLVVDECAVRMWQMDRLQQRFDDMRVGVPLTRN